MIYIKILSDVLPLRTMKRSLPFLALLVTLLLGTLTIQAQDTNLTWSGFDLRVPIDAKSRIGIKPIVRHDLNGDGYQNSSIDLVYQRSFGNGYFGQFLHRTWWLPDARYRLFFWFDVGKTWNFNKFSFTQKFRLHHARDVNEIFDADFVRSFSVLTYPISENIKLTLNLEPWLSLNDDIEINRYRIEPGFQWSIADQWTLAAVYRRQSDFRLEPQNNQNHIVWTMIYKLKTGKVE